MTFKIVLEVIAAVGTLVALAALIYQIYKDRKERKYEQAGKISCWLEDPVISDEEPQVYKDVIHISNSSNQPIYDAVLSVDIVTEEFTSIRKGDENCSYVRCIPAGDYLIEAPYADRGMNKEFAPSITFRDCLNQYWTRDGTGKLITEKRNSLDLRNISRPCSSETFVSAYKTGEKTFNIQK